MPNYKVLDSNGLIENIIVSDENFATENGYQLASENDYIHPKYWSITEEIVDESIRLCKSKLELDTQNLGGTPSQSIVDAESFLDSVKDSHETYGEVMHAIANYDYNFGAPIVGE